MMSIQEIVVPLDFDQHTDSCLYTEEENAGMIIIGTHGAQGLKKILLGNVAERVVHRAPCPVLLFNPYR